MAQRVKVAKREVAVDTTAIPEANGNGNGELHRPAGETVYAIALQELRRATENETERRRIEGGALREARGDDVLQLHATLHALTAMRDQLSQEISEVVARLGGNTGSVMEQLRAENQEGFQKTWQTLNERFDKTWETIGHNFEATNDRTSREITDLRDELTKVLDKRFTHIDQTFASLRADIEVVKALQMDLIKERIGRAEMARGR